VAITPKQAERLREAQTAHLAALDARNNEVVKAHQAGASLSEISYEVHMSTTTVMRLLNRLGVDTAERIPKPE
jgi:DNA-binding NarL/FixJ family response regulator